MMGKFLQIRSCVVCKNKFEQKKLLRFRIKNHKINKKDLTGRSFYICSDCIKKEEKILKKAVSKFVKISSLDELKGD